MQGRLAEAAAVTFALALATLLAGAASACGSAPDAPGSEEPSPPEGGLRAEAGPGPGTPQGDAAGAEAGKDAGDAGGRFCAVVSPRPKFCDDFDDGDLADDWTQSAAAPGNLLELDGTAFASAPASFHVVTSALAATAANNALLRLTVLAAMPKVTLSFAALLPAVTFDKGVVAIASVFASPSHSFTLYLRDAHATAPAATLEEYVGGTTTRHALSRLPPAGAWTRVSLELDLAGGKADLAFDGQKALDAEPLTARAGSEATIRLGAILDGPVEAFEARFDDVVVDY